VRPRLGVRKRAQWCHFWSVLRIGHRDVWKQRQISSSLLSCKRGRRGSPCGSQHEQVWAQAATGYYAFWWEGQVTGSGWFTMGLDVCLGNPRALALASVWFPSGQAAGPAHLKVISLGSHFVLTFPSSDPQPCVTGQALYHFSFPSPLHPFGFPSH
jgi:hypothetical protein